MKLASRQDIEAPLAQVWATLTDFDGWERAAMRRGVDVARTDKQTTPGPGMGWSSRFQLRGKARNVEIVITRLEAPNQISFAVKSLAIEADVTIELIEMAARRTRMMVATELRPQSLGARLFLQSLRLAKSRVDRKFDKRFAQFAREVETRARQRSA